MDRVRQKKYVLIKKIEKLMKQYPELIDISEKEKETLNECKYAYFMCFQMYKLHNELFIPIMLPFNKGFLLEGVKGIYGHTKTTTNSNGETMRIWSLIKFTPKDIMNREITREITFTKV